MTVSRSTQALAAFAALVALIAGIAILSGPGNQADAAPGKAVYLGQTNAKRVPLCPERCQSIVIVSGFQAKAGGIANAYKVPFIGKITRWRLKLGKPSVSDTRFFKSNFGAQPQAAIGVLAKKNQGGKIVYKLRRRSQVQNLTNFMGRTATFNVPGIKVNKGDYVALIVPTWAPALSVPAACEIIKVNGNERMRNAAVCDQFNTNNSWVASRQKSVCNRTPNMRNSMAQIKVDSLSPYDCRFNGALTYGVRVESR